MKRILLILALVFSAGLAFAQPYADRFFTAPMSEEDGDTITTSQVSVSSSVATLILPAITTRANRNRTIHNASVYTVYLGTQAAGTTLSTIGYDVTVSTTGNSVFRTHSTGAIYGLSGGTGSATVTVINETNSIP